MLGKLTHLYLIVLTLLYPYLSAQASPLSPLPSAISKQWQLDLVGQTKLRRLGLHIYDASFWSEKNGPNWVDRSSVSALSITYARKIKATRLLSSTKKEWDRLGFANKYPLQTWLEKLATIWPSVEKGDQLIVVTKPNAETLFFSRSEQLGMIADPEFGPAFLAIWLDEKSRYKKNRKELLGD